MKLLTRTSDFTEQSLIGSLLLDNRYIAGVSEIIEAKDFTYPDLAKIYNVIIDQWASGATADAGSVSSELPPELDEIPFDCQSGVGSAANAMFYARKIRDAATRREILGACKEISAMAKDDEREVAEIIGDAQTRMFGIAHKDSPVSITDEIIAIQKESEAASLTQDGTNGCPTFFPTIDQVTGGLRKGNLVIIAARPSIGKTAFAMNMAQNIVERSDRKVMFFSCEMTRKELLLRMISRRALIDSNALSRGNLRKDEWDEYTRASGELAELMEGNMVIDDKAGIGPGHIRAVVKQQQQAGEVSAVFVDYIQLLKVPGKYSGEVERLTELANGMKNIAKDLGVPVVLLAQLNRQSETRDEIREPGLSDLKGSGTIEEAADVIMFVHRESRTAARGKIILAKHRAGPLGTIPVTFDGKLTSFKEVL